MTFAEDVFLILVWVGALSLTFSILVGIAEIIERLREYQRGK